MNALQNQNYNPRCASANTLKDKLSGLSRPVIYSSGHLPIERRLGALDEETIDSGARGVARRLRQIGSKMPRNKKPRPQPQPQHACLADKKASKSPSAQLDGIPMPHDYSTDKFFFQPVVGIGFSRRRIHNR